MYKYFQPNKKDIKDKYGDCVVRALCKAFNQSWLDTFDEIHPISRELQIPFNMKPCYHQYILSKGGVYQKMPFAKKNSHRPTVYEFARTHKKGTYILNLANHIVAVQDGVWYDTWDCGDKCVYSYWIVYPNKQEKAKHEMMEVVKKTGLTPEQILIVLKAKEK